jgi:SAM-dependent methyltransferase
MLPLLYTELTGWYRLVDPPEDHRDEAATYEAALLKGASRDATTLLELGSGAGHNAYHLKRRFQCTLADLSPQMLGLSRELNPECEHLQGDMRCMRLDRTFDVVLLHDAVVYMTTEDDLLAAARTAFVHTKPGGAAVFAPDHLSDEFQESTELLQENDAARSMRCLAWTWDPDRTDTTYSVDYALLLRDGTHVTAVHEQHIEGLFSESTWHRILSAAGFDVETISRPVDAQATDRIFLCRRRQRGA